ncbi:hypothetical protein ACVWZR_002413 [Bradyrhizobium sp. i1.3.1]
MLAFVDSRKSSFFCIARLILENMEVTQREKSDLHSPCLNSGIESQIDLTTAERSGTLPRAEPLEIRAMEAR